MAPFKDAYIGKMLEKKKALVAKKQGQLDANISARKEVLEALQIDAKEQEQRLDQTVGKLRTVREKLQQLKDQRDAAKRAAEAKAREEREAAERKRKEEEEQKRKEAEEEARKRRKKLEETARKQAEIQRQIEEEEERAAEECCAWQPRRRRQQRRRVAPAEKLAPTRRAQTAGHRPRTTKQGARRHRRNGDGAGGKWIPLSRRAAGAKASVAPRAARGQRAARRVEAEEGRLPANQTMPVGVSGEAKSAPVPVETGRRRFVRPGGIEVDRDGGGVLDRGGALVDGDYLRGALVAATGYDRPPRLLPPTVMATALRGALVAATAMETALRGAWRRRP